MVIISLIFRHLIIIEFYYIVNCLLEVFLIFLLSIFIEFLLFSQTTTISGFFHNLYPFTFFLNLNYLSSSLLLLSKKEFCKASCAMSKSMCSILKIILLKMVCNDIILYSLFSQGNFTTKHFS